MRAFNIFSSKVAGIKANKQNQEQIVDATLTLAAIGASWYVANVVFHALVDTAVAKIEKRRG